MGLGSKFRLTFTLSNVNALLTFACLLFTKDTIVLFTVLLRDLSGTNGSFYILVIWLLDCRVLSCDLRRSGCPFYLVTAGSLRANVTLLSLMSTNISSSDC